MKTDILTVVDTDCDDSIAYFVNNEKVADIHCNDTHEIPEMLYEIMVKYNFAEVVEMRLSEDAADLYFGDGSKYAHPNKLSDYGPDDFE